MRFESEILHPLKPQPVYNHYKEFFVLTLMPYLYLSLII